MWLQLNPHCTALWLPGANWGHWDCSSGWDGGVSCTSALLGGGEMTLSPRADIGVPAAHPAKGCGVWECAQSTFSLSPPQGHCCLPPCSASPTLSNKSCCCLSPKSLYKGRIAAALGHPLGRGTPTPSSPSALHCCGSLCLESAGTLGGDLSASCSGAVSSQLPTTSICAAIKKIAGLTGRNKIKRGGRKASKNNPAGASCAHHIWNPPHVHCTLWICVPRGVWSPWAARTQPASTEPPQCIPMAGDAVLGRLLHLLQGWGLAPSCHPGDTACHPRDTVLAEQGRPAEG